MVVIFWLSVFVLLYHLIFYGFILWLINLFKKKQNNKIEIKEYPSITVLCAAYNEANIIGEKIQSFLDLDYPKDKIKMIVISDDSTDGTNEIVEGYAKKYDNIELVVQKPRRGKQSAHNLVQPSLDTDYVLSTDANSIFEPDAVKHLVQKMNSNPKIGMVSGELKLITEKGDSGEGLYWKYESFIKIIESRFRTIICANGSLYLIRRKLFGQIHPTSSDDFERTLVCLKEGYIAKYNSEAIVYEQSTDKPMEEKNRKIRIISREWFALYRNKNLLCPWRFPLVSFMLISHKVARWLIFIPSILILILNCFLFTLAPFYKALLIIQLLVYLIGIIEIMIEKKDASIKIFKLPGYYVLMIYVSIVAFIKFLSGSSQTTWSTIRK